MGKSKIIKELANNEITIDTALKRLLVLASDLGDIELKNWAHKELYGYDKNDVLPDYRIVKNLNLFYTGIVNCFRINNQPLPLAYLSSETINHIEENKILEPISNIVENSRSVNNRHVVKNRTELAGEIYKNTGGEYGGVQCVSIMQEFDAATWLRIINKLNIILLEIFIKLDKAYGNLDNLDVDLSKKSEADIESTKQAVKNIIYNNCTFYDNSKTVDKSKVKNSNIANSSNNAKQTAKEDKRKAKNSAIGGKENKLEKKTEINTKAKFDF